MLGMKLLDREPGRSLFFRAGASVFLMFDAEATAGGGKLPPHGARGSVHTCFEVPDEDYEGWKARLAGRGVDVLTSGRAEAPPAVPERTGSVLDRMKRCLEKSYRFGTLSNTRPIRS